MATTATPPGAAGDPRCEICNYLVDDFLKELARDVLDGLTGEQKSLPSKYFYDTRGSRLFEEICRLPEYYQTRAEISILREQGGVIMDPFLQGDLVEMGSGASWKICLLIQAAQRPQGEHLRYIPVDVSESAILAAAGELMHRFRALKILGLVADFTRQLHLLPQGATKLISFFGSTIGNFDPVQGEGLLRMVSDLMLPEDRFLLGLDMVKQRDILEAAYNDSRGVTREFNKNILQVINRELYADFDLEQFEHLAIFNEEQDQVEMHLRARESTEVEIRDLGITVQFKKGETMLTEISRKFRREKAEEMFDRAGLSVVRWFPDQRGWFSLVELACGRS